MFKSRNQSEERNYNVELAKDEILQRCDKIIWERQHTKFTFPNKLRT